MSRDKGFSGAVQGMAGVLLLRLLGALPLPAARALTRSLTAVAWRLVPRLRRVGWQNIDLAYGDTITREQKRRILAEALDNLAIVAAEMAHLPKVARRQFDPDVEFTGLEHLEPEQGALLIGGHIANWEWTATAIASRGVRIAGVVRPLDSPKLNALVDQLRTSAGLVTLPKHDIGNDLLQRLRSGWKVGVLIDQSPRDNGVPSTFFGAPCWSTAAPALIAARARVPVHLVRMWRMEDGRYRIDLSPRIPLEKTGDFTDDLVRNTQISQDAFEQVVRDYPGQWLWFHRRWKKRERLEQEWAAREQRQKKRTRTTGANASEDR